VGIAWIRGLLRDFADRGGTVLLSSHLLAEVQATADHLIIIDHGRMVASGTQRSLLADTGQILEGLFLSLTSPKDSAVRTVRRDVR
jgi:ABC-2 type transport system ATP-binding protein